MASAPELQPPELLLAELLLLAPPPPELLLTEADVDVPPAPPAASRWMSSAGSRPATIWHPAPNATSAPNMNPTLKLRFVFILPLASKGQRGRVEADDGPNLNEPQFVTSHVGL
jgi:hypothetical protein